jgi:hypothetical protein
MNTSTLKSPNKIGIFQQETSEGAKNAQRITSLPRNSTVHLHASLGQNYLPTTTNSAASSRDLGNRVYHPTDFDILLGRGKPFQSHHGNMFMLHVIDHFRVRYLQAERRGKHGIIEEVMGHIKVKGGRFLSRVEYEEYWTEVKHSIAYRKVGHAFRSKARRCTGKEEESSTISFPPVGVAGLSQQGSVLGSHGLPEIPDRFLAPQQPRMLPMGSGVAASRLGGDVDSFNRSLMGMNRHPEVFNRALLPHQATRPNQQVVFVVNQPSQVVRPVYVVQVEGTQPAMAQRGAYGMQGSIGSFAMAPSADPSLLYHHTMSGQFPSADPSLLSHRTIMNDRGTGLALGGGSFHNDIALDDPTLARAQALLNHRRSRAGLFARHFPPGFG